MKEGRRSDEDAGSQFGGAMPGIGGGVVELTLAAGPCTRGSKRQLQMLEDRMMITVNRYSNKSLVVTILKY